LTNQGENFRFFTLGMLDPCTTLKEHDFHDDPAVSHLPNPLSDTWLTNTFIP
jgi:hypothetical protein